jgi:hypothetical protein
VSQNGFQADYDGAVYTPTEAFMYEAVLERSGRATLTPRGRRAPEEEEEELLKIAKSTARAAARRAADGLEPWPPRVLRWRGPGRGS